MRGGIYGGQRLADSDESGFAIRRDELSFRDCRTGQFGQGAFVLWKRVAGRSNQHCLGSVDGSPLGGFGWSLGHDLVGIRVVSHLSYCLGRALAESGPETIVLTNPAICRVFLPLT